MIYSASPRSTKKLEKYALGVGAVLLVLMSSAVTKADSNSVKIKSKRQYVENDDYFKASRLNSLSTKLKKEEKPWGVGFHMASGTNISTTEGDRIYDQTLSLSGAWKLKEKLSLGLQSSLSYYSVGNNIPKEEGNPKWDDLSLSLSNEMPDVVIPRLAPIKLAHSVSGFAPTSYDSQYEGIKTGLSYGVNAAHPFFFLDIGHNLALNYTAHSFGYSPTTGRQNSAWTNSYTFTVGASHKFDKRVKIGISENISNRSSFDNDYFLTTSTLVYGSWIVNQVKLSLNYLVGNYDKNDTVRYFYVNDWEQKISLGLSYDL